MVYFQKVREELVLNDYVDFDNKKLVKFDRIQESAIDELNAKIKTLIKKKKINGTEHY